MCELCVSSIPPSFFYLLLHKVIQYLSNFPSFRLTILTGTRAPPQDPAHTLFLLDAVSHECKRLFLFLSKLFTVSFFFSYKAAVNLSLLLSPHLSLLPPVVPFSSSPYFSLLQPSFFLSHCSIHDEGSAEQQLCFTILTSPICTCILLSPSLA